MSTTIDERVVEMRFDNDNFESNVNESISTLAKLKQSLNLTGASKGLEAVNNAAKRVSFAPIANAMDQVTTRFSHAQMTIQHQIDRWADKIVGAAERAVKALTIDPIKSGFQEYETQINSVQTILANTQSKGTTLNDVNSALDTLNKYADKTIYNFTEMTRNIGTFTAAGVDLDTSVNAIQGIANLAAVSGSTSQQASTAMYQLSQALASGTVKLMDWNSVVNAGMGGQVFQDALKETARVHGIAIDDMIKKNGSFRETLKDGWLTSEILTETLQKFTLTTEGLTKEQIEANRQMLKSKGYTEAQIDEIFKLGEMATNAATKVKTFTQLFDTLKEAAQSGWTQTWETIVGDFDESKELMTNISDVIGGFINASAEARNNLLSESLDNNWEKLVKEINAAGIETNVFEEKARAAMEAHGLDVDALIEEHGSLANVFKSGAVSSDILQEAVNKLTGKLVDLSKIQRELKKGHTGDDVKAAQEALKNMGYDLGKAGIDGKFGTMTEKAVKAFQELNGLEVTGIIDDKTLEALEKASESSAKLSKNCDDLISKITELGGREKIIESLKNVFKYLGDVVKPVKEAFREIFPKTEASQIVSVIDSFHNFTKALKVSSDQAAKIKSTFKGFFSILDIGIELVKQLARGAFGIISNFTGIGGSILDATSSIGDWLSGLRDTIKETDIFGTAVDKIVGFVTMVVGKLKEFKSSADDAFEGSKLKGFLGFFEKLWSFISTIGSKIGELGANIFKSIAETAGDPNTWNVLSSGLFAGIFAGIARFVNKLPSLIGGIDDIVENVTNILDDVRGCFQAYQTQLKAGTLMKIASAIAILVAAIFVLSTINAEGLDRSIGAITILFGELLGAFAAFGKISGDMKGVVKASTMMSSIASSLVILAIALKILSTMNWDQLSNGIVAIGGLLIEIGVFMRLAKFDGKIIKTSTALVILSVGLIILAKAVKSFGSMKWDEIARGLAAMAGALIAVVAAMALMPKNWTASIDGFGKLKSTAKLVSAGIMFIAVAAAMKIFASAMQDFSKLKWEDIAKGLSSIAIIMAVVAGMVSKMQKNAIGNMPRNMISLGIGIIAMAAAVKIFASAVGDFAKHSWENLAKGLGSIAVILAGITIAINKLPKKGAANMIGFGVSMVIIAGAISILVDVLEQIKNFSWKEIGKGMTVVAGSLVLLCAAVAWCSGVKSGAVALLVAAAALAVIAPVLKTLGAMSLKSIVKALVALAGALAIIGVASVLLQPVIPAILALAGALTAVGVAALALGAGIVLISIGFATLATAGAAGATALVAALTIIVLGVINLIPSIVKALGQVILAVCEVIVTCAPTIAETVLTVILEVLKSLETYAPQILDSLLGLLIGLLRSLADHLPELIVVAMEVIGAFFQGIVDALNGMDTETIFKGLIGAGLLAGLMFALSAVVSLIPGAMAGVLGMGAVVAEMALVIAAIGALSKIPGISWLVEEGGEFLEKIGTAIGKFVGGIVGGVLEGATSTLPSVATNLSDFMTNLQPFIDGSKQIDASLLDSVKTLAGIMIALTAADLFESITSWITGGDSLSDFAAKLIPFGEAMVSFSDTVTGRIDEGAVTAAANAGAAIASLQSELYGAGGLKQDIFGEKDLLNFGAQLVAFGSAIVGFSAKVDGKVKESAVTAAANAGKAIVSLQNELYGAGGLKQGIFGEKDLSQFGTQLTSFGEAIVAFSGKVDGKISEEAVNAAARAGTMMTDLQKNIPEEGWFDGKVNLEEFGSTIVKYGEKLVDYSDKVSEMDTATVADSLTATLTLVNIAKALQQIDSASTLLSLAPISDIATKLKDFGTKMGEVDIAKLGSSVDIALRLKGLIVNLSNIDTRGVDRFKTAIEKLSQTNFSDLTSAFEGNAEKLANIGSDIVKFLCSGMENQQGNFNATANKLVMGLSTAITSKEETFITSGKNLMDKFMKALSSGKKTSTKVMNEIITACLASARNKVTSFTSAGRNLAEGFANGISANSYKAVAKAKAMAEAAKQAAEEALGIASPSKVFYKIGDYTGQGFINALAGYASKAYRSATDMGDSAKSGLNDALSKAYDIINGDLETQPTIRPVLDLSSVEAGASRMNGLLNGVSNVGVMTNMNAIGSMMEQRRQNGSNADVVSAIDKLRKGLGNTGGTTYNINGVSYDDGSNIANAVETIARAALRERRT